MKKCLIRGIFLCLLVAMVVSVAVSANAANLPYPEVDIQASEYFASRKAEIMAAGSGKIKIELDVKATDVMQELGASDIYVYEVQSDGRYTEVYHYTKSTHPVLIQKNDYRSVIQVTYQGTAGKSYYVAAWCYAKNASGSQTTWIGSNVVKAT